MDYKNLTLSDFYNMDIIQREDGTLTPMIEEVNGKRIGLPGFNGDKKSTPLEIKEAAYHYYKKLIEELNK